jgi:hypothetical protein
MLGMSDQFVCLGFFWFSFLVGIGIILISAFTLIIYQNEAFAPSKVQDFFM